MLNCRRRYRRILVSIFLDPPEPAGAARSAPVPARVDGRAMPARLRPQGAGPGPGRGRRSRRRQSGRAPEPLGARGRWLPRGGARRAAAAEVSDGRRPRSGGSGRGRGAGAERGGSRGLRREAAPRRAGTAEPHLGEALPARFGRRRCHRQRCRLCPCVLGPRCGSSRAVPGCGGARKRRVWKGQRVNSRRLRGDAGARRRTQG